MTGAKAQANIKADRGRLTEEDIERMIADAERYREEDEALSRKISLKNALEQAVYRVKSSCTERYTQQQLYVLLLINDVLEMIFVESRTWTIFWTGLSMTVTPQTSTRSRRSAMNFSAAMACELIPSMWIKVSKRKAVCESSIERCRYCFHYKQFYRLFFLSPTFPKNLVS